MFRELLSDEKQYSQLHVRGVNAALPFLILWYLLCSLVVYVDLSFSEWVVVFYDDIYITSSP